MHPDDAQPTSVDNSHISIDQLRAGISMCVGTGDSSSVGQIYHKLTYQGAALLEITQTTDNGQRTLVISERVFCPACKSGETNRISQQILKSLRLKIRN